MPEGGNIMPDTLRAASLGCGFSIGASADPGWLRTDAEYARILSSQFDMLTPENVMKAGPIHPERDRFEFAPADALVNFAQRHEMRVHGHALVWHNQLPGWLLDRSWTPDEWQCHLESHIRTVVGHFRGNIAAWDVVNEAVADDGSLRDTPWLRGLGPAYLESAFRIAHEEDPSARLFYNDYGAEGLGAKSDSVFHLLQRLLDKGIPVRGVGLQMHVTPEEHPPLHELAANMERLGRLGLEVHITEMDVRLRQPADAKALERQAKLYADVLDVCLGAAHCTALVQWGVADRHSWIPGYFPGWGQALVFDEEYRPKPAHQALLERLVAGGSRRQGL
jgi:endo-1,4-beta-xylanase